MSALLVAIETDHAGQSSWWLPRAVCVWPSK